MNPFETSHSLLNAKFEGYKLEPVAEDTVQRYPLEHKPTQIVLSNRSPLTFQEVQSRITHNHLCMSANGERALYIDAEYKVVLVQVDKETLRPSFRVAYELPRPIQSTNVEDTRHREYPSAAFLDPKTVFVSDGHGTLFVLAIAEEGVAALLGVHELLHEDTQLLPFRVHKAVSASTSLAVALLSARHYTGAAEASSSEGPPGSRKPIKRARFDVWAVQFRTPFESTTNDAQKLDILWRRRGEDVPVHTAYDQSRNAFILIGSSMYHRPDAPVTPAYEPSPDEIAPIPREGENLDLDVKAEGLEKPPPYSWTQTPDSLTVAFPLPSSTHKTNIKVSFSPRTLTVRVDADASVTAPLPRYSMKELWDSILPSTSFWTWDREAEHAFGLLTLHLDKQHEGTKWVQLFANTTPPNPEDDVPETLDPSELWHIRESLEKYTSSLRDGTDASGLGLGRGLPSLAEGEMDDEVDSSVGRTVHLSWVALDGSTPSWVSERDEMSFNLLAAPWPGIDDTRLSLVVKDGLDGTAHTLEPATNATDAPVWTHTATFSALAFVLASKLDTRFTYHLSSPSPSTRAVFAFDSGARNRGGNVHIYRGARPTELWAKQRILRAGDGLAGSLLGVGAMNIGPKSVVVLGLSENQLLTISTIF